MGPHGLTGQAVANLTQKEKGDEGLKNLTKKGRRVKQATCEQLRSLLATLQWPCMTS